jgi:replicative DNA helicase
MLNTPDLLKGVSTTSDVLDAAIGGWANGLIVITGETGHGKSTFSTWQLWELAKAGHTVAITSFEQQPEQTVMQLLAMEFGGDPTGRSDQEQDAALDRLASYPLYIVDHYGNVPYTKLEEAIKYAVRRCGVRYILIDHLGFLVSPEAEDERRAIEAVIRSLVLIRKDMDVTMFLIVHPRNDPDAAKKWGRVTMQHIKGASAIRQDADLVLIVTRELPNQVKGRMCPKDKPRPWPQARIYIDKKRGRFGAVSGAGEVVLAFDPKSQVFADTWAQTPMGKTGALMDAVNTETPDEGDEPKARGTRKAGTSGHGRGRKTRETTDF